MQYCLGFRCSYCFTEFNFDDLMYICPKDGANLDIILDINCLRRNYPSPSLFGSSENSMWKYLPLLPVDEPEALNTPLRSVGCTPIFRSDYLSSLCNHDYLWIKDDSRNPTGSLKDRASALVVVKAQQDSADVVITASTGNAGAALAGMSASVGQKAVILAPQNAPPAKIAQLLIYGAQVILVEGSYDDAFDLSILASKEFNWYCRNTGYNPFTVEGKKTISYELWEFMKSPTNYIFRDRRWNVFVSMGDGNIISGVYKGFKDLFELGWINTLPRIFGVQAEGSAAIAKTFLEGGTNISPVKANTIADSISVDLPRDGMRAIRAMKESGTAPILIDDNDMLYAMQELGKAGIFAEPASAASFAGFMEAKRLGMVGDDDPTIIINTGSGLKDINSALKATKPASIIQPKLNELAKVVKLKFNL